MLCLNVSNTFSYNTVDNTFTVYLVSHIYIYIHVFHGTVCMFPCFSAWEAAKTEGSSKPAWVSVAHKRYHVVFGVM